MISLLPTPSAAKVQEDAETISIGNLTLDLRNFETSVDGCLVELTYQEFELLRFFIAELEHVLPYDAFSQHLWGSRGRDASRRLNVMVYRLRAKLQRLRPYEICTVRGRGYGLLKA